MIRKLFLLILFFSISSYAQKQGKTLVADIKGEEFILKLDVEEYKLFIKTQFFNNEEVEFNSIEVKKQLTLGTKREFYYLLLKDTKRHIKVARWLKKNEKNLYLNNEFGNNEDIFEQIYLVCQGIEDCDPEIAELDGIMSWGCGKEISCPAFPEEGEPKCKSFTVFIDGHNIEE